MTTALLALAIGAAAAAAQRPAPGAEGRPGRGDAMGGRLLHGIQLSDAERTRIEAIRSTYRARFTAARDSARPDRQAMMQARLRGDTAAVRQAMERGARRHAAMFALGVRAQAEIRAALTPEHQRVFDVNRQQVQQQVQEHMERRMNDSGPRGPRGGPGMRRPGMGRGGMRGPGGPGHPGHPGGPGEGARRPPDA